MKISKKALSSTCFETTAGHRLQISKQAPVRTVEGAREMGDGRWVMGDERVASANVLSLFAEGGHNRRSVTRRHVGNIRRSSMAVWNRENDQV